ARRGGRGGESGGAGRRPRRGDGGPRRLEPRVPHRTRGGERGGPARAPPLLQTLRAPAGDPPRRDGDVVLTWWQAVVLGLVEGITGYFPGSSRGKRILASPLLLLVGPEGKDGLGS